MPISLSGSLNLSGSLTTTGTITATTLVVQTITSSISSITGSTNFGSLVTDTHTFTGSLNVTGSLAVVTTGTEFQVTSAGVKIGNVIGDNHSITGSVGISGSAAFASTIASAGDITITKASAVSFIANNTSASGKSFRLVSSDDGTFRIQNTGVLDILTLTFGGAATFSGNVVTSTYFNANNSTRDIYLNSSADFGFGSAPAIQVASNHNLQFATNNSLRMVITSGSLVGIGTHIPMAQLSMNNQKDGGATPVSSYAAITGINGQNFFNGYYAYNSDGLGPFPRYFDIVSVGQPDGSNGGSNIRFFTNPIALSSPAVERMRITSGGNVLVGTTATETSALTALAPSTGTVAIQGRNPNSTTAPIFQASSVTVGSTSWYAYVAQSGNGSAVTVNTMFVYGNGNLVNVNNSYGTLSDIKLKENIVDATPKLDHIMQLKVRNFNLKADESKTKQIGFIAQELEEVFPGIIEEVPDRDIENNDLGTVTKTIKTSVLVPMLVKAIQELTARVQYLENK
jgi:hypothetical protein